MCDIFHATPADLIVTAADNVGVRKTATDDASTTPAVALLLLALWVC